MTTHLTLTDINGIGPAKAIALKQRGIKTVADLAEASLDNIATVPGFGVNSADQVRSLALFFIDGNDEIGAGQSDSAETAVSDETTKKSKKAGKKGKRGKKAKKDEKRSKKTKGKGKGKKKAKQKK